MPISAATRCRNEHQHDVLLQRGGRARGACVAPEVQQRGHGAAPGTGSTRQRVEQHTHARIFRSGDHAGRVADDETPPVEHADPGRERERLGHVVRDEDDGGVQLLLDPDELALKLDACHRVERAERFVHQENRRIERRALARRPRVAAGRPRAPRAIAPQKSQLAVRPARAVRAPARGCDPRPNLRAAAPGRRSPRPSCAGKGRCPEARSRCAGAGGSDPTRACRVPRRARFQTSARSAGSRA